MPDTPAAPAPAAPAPAASDPQPAPAPATGEDLVPVVGLRPVTDPGDSYPLGNPHGTTPAPVPPGAIDERAA